MDLLRDAIEYVVKHRRKGVECPCCGQFAKTYKRKLNSGMARTLIVCWPMFREYPDRYLDVVNYCAKKHDFIAGDHGKLVAWGLLEKKPGARNDGSSRNSHYRLTSLGKAFVLNQQRVPKYFYFYNNRALDHSNETISITEALGSHFNYSELMVA